MFTELFNMPIAYDMGIDIKDLRKRKPHRKGVKSNKYPNKETIVITSKELADITGQAMIEILTKG